MSGHSKWAQIKRQKAVTDVKRGQAFTKLGREIANAARQGGGDPDMNFRLRLAMQRAREQNMPMENIERAIKRGTGALEGETLEEIVYEGYGPGGVAFMVQALTTNRNRTVADIRNVFTRAGGRLGEAGSVAYLFDQKGIIGVEPDRRDPDELGLLAIDAGAEDARVEDGLLEVVTEPSQLEAVRRALLDAAVKVTSAEVSLVPRTTVPVEGREATSVLKLAEKLEDLDDVQEVFTNADFPHEMMEQVAAS